ncbi:MAG: DUF1385 domain-containing protein [Clostridia bacterium]|nr:DUF1385 domain-containing protein [Clostridia bacterium]
MSTNHKTSIGGQALIEGVMMRGPKTTAMAVRNPEGELVIEKWDTEGINKPKILKLPFIRGIFNMIDSLRFGYKCLMRSAEIAGFEEEEKETKSHGLIMGLLMTISSVVAVIISIGLFMWLPAKLYELTGLSKDSRFLRSAFEGVVKIIIFILYLLLTLLMKDIRRTFSYHGAEHKTIFCYEAGLPLTVENVRKQRRFHPRCGTSFLILVLLVGIFVSMIIPASLPAYIRTPIKLLLLPVIVGIGYELIKLAGRRDNLFTKIISAPGVWLQHITTREPDDSMIEAAIAAMNEVVTGNPEDDKW